MEIKKFEPTQDHLYLNSLITCYREVFSGEPWNEWLECTICNKVFGKNDGLSPFDRCPFCGSNLTFFWKEDAVKKDILNEIAGDAVCEIITIGTKVVGFCWGYPVDADSLEKKLLLPNLAKTIREKFGANQLGYIDEVGILPEYRLQGLGKKLWGRLERSLAEKKCKIIIARSQPKVKMFDWWLKTGYQIIQKYSGKDARAIIACAT